MKILTIILAAGLGIAAATLSHFKMADPQPASSAVAFNNAGPSGQQIAALQDTLAGALADLSMNGSRRGFRRVQQP